MPRIDFVTGLHKRTKRNYLERVTRHDKAECAGVAVQFCRDYWGGNRLANRVEIVYRPHGLKWCLILLIE
jgi:hypothetical protein